MGAFVGVCLVCTICMHSGCACVYAHVLWVQHRSSHRLSWWVGVWHFAALDIVSALLC